MSYSDFQKQIAKDVVNVLIATGLIQFDKKRYLNKIYESLHKSKIPTSEARGYQSRAILKLARKIFAKEVKRVPTQMKLHL